LRIHSLLPQFEFSYSENIAKRSRLRRGLSAYLDTKGCGSLNEPIAVGSRFLCAILTNNNINHLKPTRRWDITAQTKMGKWYRCPTCGNTGEIFSYVRRCEVCGMIYCDRCGGATCPSCGASYTKAENLGYIG
jgi:hypothetical protein